MTQPDPPGRRPPARAADDLRPEDNWMNSREAAAEFGVDLDEDDADEEEDT